MKLYCSANSPYARKVRVAAIELGIISRIEVIDTNARDPNTGLWALNPLAKIPALTTDAGEAIYDSPIICEYLNEAIGDGSLLPAGDGERWRVRTLTALADGVMDAGMAVRLENLRPETERSPAWIEKNLATVARGLDALQRHLRFSGANPRKSRPIWPRSRPDAASPGSCSVIPNTIG